MHGIQRHPSTLHRIVAMLGVALVLVLNVLAVSPRLHAWIHGHDGVCAGSADPSSAGDAAQHHHESEPVGDSDHQCAVTLFASGVPVLLALCLLVLARSLACCFLLPAGDWLGASLPHYWHLPAIGPPLA